MDQDKQRHTRSMDDRGRSFDVSPEHRQGVGREENQSPVQVSFDGYNGASDVQSQAKLLLQNNPRLQTHKRQPHRCVDDVDDVGNDDDKPSHWLPESQPFRDWVGCCCRCHRGGLNQGRTFGHLVEVGDATNSSPRHVPAAARSITPQTTKSES